MSDDAASGAAPVVAGAEAPVARKQRKKRPRPLSVAGEKRAKQVLANVGARVGMRRPEPDNETVLNRINQTLHSLAVALERREEVGTENLDQLEDIQECVKRIHASVARIKKGTENAKQG